MLEKGNVFFFWNMVYIMKKFLTCEATQQRLYTVHAHDIHPTRGITGVLVQQ